MTSKQALIPPVIWAQRSNVVYVTFCVEDCKNPHIEIEPKQIVFRGVAGLEQKAYDLTISLFGEVEPDKSKKIVGGRYIELVLQKTPDDVKYWPHLTEEKKKYHWLKVDFKKWKDEDDSDDETGGSGGGLGGDSNIDDMLSMMGGGGARSGPKFGDLSGDFNEPSDEDSDDEDMPELDDIESVDPAVKAREVSGIEDLPKLEEIKPAKTA